MRSLRAASVLLVALLVGSGALGTRAALAQEEGSVPTQPETVPVQPDETVGPATPVPEIGPPGTRLGTVQVPGGETVPIVEEGPLVPLSARRLVLGMGQGAAQVFVKMNMSKNVEGQPTTISPDIYYGVTNYVQLGLVHTSPLGWQTPGNTPNALCVTGKNDGCPKVYNNLGIDAVGLALTGPVELAGHARFDFDPLDPFRVNLLLGFIGKLRLPWFSIVAYPSIQIGLNKRNQAGGPTPDGNKEMLYFPGEIVFQVSPLLAILGQAAFYTQAEGFTDHYRIPLGVAAMFTVSPLMDLGLRWGWDNLAKTTPGVGRGDERSLVALGNLHF